MTVAAQVRRAGLAGIIGVTRDINVQGEAVQKLDVIANQTLLQFLGNRGNVAIMASEENEDPVIVERDRKHGKHVVVFDPLDGSSNIDVNVSVGTIFSVLRREPDPSGTRDVMADVLQPGYRQIAAGYVVYGSSTMLVYSAGTGVHGFTLDPAIGARGWSLAAGKRWRCSRGLWGGKRISRLWASSQRSFPQGLPQRRKWAGWDRRRRRRQWRRWGGNRSRSARPRA